MSRVQSDLSIEAFSLRYGFKDENEQAGGPIEIDLDDDEEAEVSADGTGETFYFK
jgi:hypothetical protein